MARPGRTPLSTAEQSLLNEMLPAGVCDSLLADNITREECRKLLPKRADNRDYELVVDYFHAVENRTIPRPDKGSLQVAVRDDRVWCVQRSLVLMLAGLAVRRYS